MDNVETIRTDLLDMPNEDNYKKMLKDVYEEKYKNLKQEDLSFEEQKNLFAYNILSYIAGFINDHKMNDMQIIDLMSIFLGYVKTNHPNIKGNNDFYEKIIYSYSTQVHHLTTEIIQIRKLLEEKNEKIEQLYDNTDSLKTGQKHMAGYLLQLGDRAKNIEKNLEKTKKYAMSIARVEGSDLSYMKKFPYKKKDIPLDEDGEPIPYLKDKNGKYDPIDWEQTRNAKEQAAYNSEMLKIVTDIVEDNARRDAFNSFEVNETLKHGFSYVINQVKEDMHNVVNEAAKKFKHLPYGIVEDAPNRVAPRQPVGTYDQVIEKVYYQAHSQTDAIRWRKNLDNIKEYEKNKYIYALTKDFSKLRDYTLQKKEWFDKHVAITTAGANAANVVRKELGRLAMSIRELDYSFILPYVDPKKQVGFYSNIDDPVDLAKKMELKYVDDAYSYGGRVTFGNLKSISKEYGRHVDDVLDVNSVPIDVLSTPHVPKNLARSTDLRVYSGSRKVKEWKEKTNEYCSRLMWHRINEVAPKEFRELDTRRDLNGLRPLRNDDKAIDITDELEKVSTIDEFDKVKLFYKYDHTGE